MPTSSCLYSILQHPLHYLEGLIRHVLCARLEHPPQVIFRTKVSDISLSPTSHPSSLRSLSISRSVRHVLKDWRHSLHKINRAFLQDSEYLLSVISTHGCIVASGRHRKMGLCDQDYHEFSTFCFVSALTNTSRTLKCICLPDPMHFWLSLVVRPFTSEKTSSSPRLKFPLDGYLPSKTSFSS